MDNDLRSGEILRGPPLSRIGNRSPLAFHPWFSFFQWIPLGEVHFFLCPDKERNEPKKENRRPVLLGLAPILYGGQLETRFAQTVELLNPPPLISASLRAGRTANGRGAEWDFDVCRRRAVPGAEFACGVMLTAGSGAACGKFSKAPPPIDLRRRTAALRPALCALRFSSKLASSRPGVRGGVGRLEQRSTEKSGEILRIRLSMVYDSSVILRTSPSSNGRGAEWDFDVPMYDA